MSLLNDPGIIVAGAVRSEEMLDLDYLGNGRGWWIDDEFVFELWIMIISTTCPFLSSGTHLEEGCSKWSNLSR